MIGGLASGGAYPGANRLWLDDAVIDEGAVGVVVQGDVRVHALVSQGCRPIGKHFVITKGQTNVIEQLGGRPALEVLQGVLEGLSERDRALFQRALHIGRVIDEYRSDFRRGDFLVRSVMGVDRANGSIAINDYVRRGQTIQFHVRDPASATEDLDLILRENAAKFTEPAAAGALLFSCNGRGSHMFATPNHDVTAIARGVGPVPLAGFFAAGEVGPIGGQNFLHGFTASMAFFCRKT
jgi:small ligand-binding sensory domain FIST